VRRVAIVSLSLLLGTAAFAQPDSGPYIGVAAGSFSYEESDDDFGTLIDVTTSSYRLIGGYQIHESLAVGGGIGKTGDIKESFPLAPFGSGSLDVRAEYEVLTVRALWLVPVSSVDLFGGVGYFDATVNVDVSATGFGSLGESEEDDSGATLFGGLHFYLDNVTLRGEYEWFDSDGDVDTWNLAVGVLFHF
jgi:hypothetical protein